jgi:Telomere resolvase ResT/TelK catalytic domain
MDTTTPHFFQAPYVQAFLADAREVNTQLELLSMLVDITRDYTAYEDLIASTCEQHIHSWLAAHPYGSVKRMIQDCQAALTYSDLSRGFQHYLRMPKSEVSVASRAYKANQEHRHKNQYPISPEQAEALVETATRLLTSSTYPSVVVGLCLITGRRPYEVAVTSHFQLHDHPALHAQQYLYACGIAKTRDAERAHQSVEIPMLIDPALVCEARERLRAMKDVREFHPDAFPTGTTGASTAFMRSYGARFREQCTRHFHPLVPDMPNYLDGHAVTPQSLRKFYEALVEAWWDYTGWAVLPFIVSILAHYDDRNVGSYLDVCLTRQVPKRFVAKHVIEKGHAHE